MECEYCRKKFTSKSNLTTHQKTTKYCLEIQGKIGEGFKCEYCTKIYTQSQSLETHISICKEKQKANDKQKEIENLQLIKKLQTELTLLKRNYHEILKEKESHYQEIIKEKSEYITKLESRLDRFETTVTNMATEPKTTTTNNNTNNTSNVTFMNKFDINDTKQISNVLQKYLTKDVIARGQEGIALMLGEHLLKGPNGEPLYECTDVARQKFEFVNADGNIETDPKATKLIRSINNSGLCQQATAAANDLWTNSDGRMDTDKYGVYAGKVTEVMQLEKDSTKLRNKLASVTARQKRGKK